MPIVPIDLQKATENVSLLVYGYTGVGKTHFAGTAPANLFLDLEDGYRTLLNLPNEAPSKSQNGCGLSSTSSRV